MKWLVRGVVALVAAYVLLGGAVALAMIQTPERFSRFMTYVPMPVVWGVVPGQRIWMWAREGPLREGDEAPDFTLSTHDHASRVSLSSYRGERPVVLVFGSYT